MPDELQVGVVDDLEHMVRPAQDAHEARCLLEQRPQGPAFRGQLKVRM